MPSPFAKASPFAPMPLTTFDESRFTKVVDGSTYWWNGTTWASLARDPNIANVVFLSHCDSNHIGYLYDESPAHGGAVRSSTVGGSIGRYSPFSDGCCVVSSANTNGLAFVARTAALGTADFTAEMWVYLTTTALNQEFFDFRPTDTVTNGPFFVIKTSNVIAYLKTGSAYDITGATTVTLNAWHHIHMTRISDVVYLGLDGSQQGSDLADTTNYTSTICYIGQQSLTPAVANIVGRYAEIRISKVARYARTYTVPTTPFSNT